MGFVIGIAGIVLLAGLYVGLGLADRGRRGCGGCAHRGLDDPCGMTCSGAEDEALRREG